jgi:hypothetical protein
LLFAEGIVKLILFPVAIHHIRTPSLDGVLICAPTLMEPLCEPAKLQKHALEVGALISTPLRLNKHKLTQNYASSCMRRRGIDDNETSSFGQLQCLKKMYTISNITAC